MLTTVLQACAATRICFTTIFNRKTSSLIAIVSVALVSMVLSATLSLYQAFSVSMGDTGRADNVLVLSGSADRESGSEIPRAAIDRFSGYSMLKRSDDGEPVTSASAITYAPVRNSRSGLDAFVTVRGIQRQFRSLHPEIRIISGRWFEPGKNELVVGRSAAERFTSLSLGGEVTVGQDTWNIVGVFESGSNALQSEILADANGVITTLRRDSYNSLTLGLQNATTLSELRVWAQGASLGNFQLEREDIFYSGKARAIEHILSVLGLTLGTLMALGATFSVLNTMYASVTSRRSEIGTLRAIGFRGLPLAFSVIAESILLSICGLAIGFALVRLLLGDKSVGVMTGISPSQLAVQLHIGTSVLMPALCVTFLIALVGGLLPAITASRQSVRQCLQFE